MPTPPRYDHWVAMGDGNNGGSALRELVLLAVGAALAVVGGVATTLMASQLNRENDTLSFLREQRLAAYSEALTSMQQYEEAYNDFIVAYTPADSPGTQTEPAPPEAELEAMRSALSQVQVIGSTGAVDSAEKALGFYTTATDFLRWEYEGRADAYNPSEWTLLDSGVDYMNLINSCLATQARAPFRAAIRQDLGVESEQAESSPKCADLDWELLVRSYKP